MANGASPAEEGEGKVSPAQSMQPDPNAPRCVCAHSSGPTPASDPNGQGVLTWEEEHCDRDEAWSPGEARLAQVAQEACGQRRVPQRSRCRRDGRPQVRSGVVRWPGEGWGGEERQHTQVQTKSMDLLPQPSWAAEVKLNRLAASAAGTDTLGGGRRWEAGAGWGLLGLGWGLLVSWDP